MYINTLEDLLNVQSGANASQNVDQHADPTVGTNVGENADSHADSTVRPNIGPNAGKNADSRPTEVSSKLGAYEFLVFSEILALNSNPSIFDYASRDSSPY
jgi:hypothetical protein